MRLELTRVGLQVELADLVLFFRLATLTLKVIRLILLCLSGWQLWLYTTLKSFQRTFAFENYFRLIKHICQSFKRVDQMNLESPDLLTEGFPK